MKTITKSAAVAVGLAATLGSGILIGTALADQPHMQAALHALQNADAELHTAVADKGGHRDNAIALIDKAISEVHAGIDYAR